MKWTLRRRRCFQEDGSLSVRMTASLQSYNKLQVWLRASKVESVVKVVQSQRTGRLHRSPAGTSNDDTIRCWT